MAFATVLAFGALVLAALPAAAAPTARDVASAQAQRILDQRAARQGTAAADFADVAGDNALAGSLLVTTADAAAARAVTTFARATFSAATTRTVAERVAHVEVDAADAGAVASALRAQPDVVAVEANVVREFYAAPNDQLYPQQFAHQRTGIEAAWDVTTGSTDVLIAVGDSGAVATHPDLGANIGEQVDGGTGEIRPGAEDNDLCQVGHGTWVSGVVGAVGNNGAGVAGTNWTANILDINTADPNVTCAGPTDVGTIAAISYATQQGADVVNLSLGGPAPSCPTALQAAVDEARAGGTVVVAAAGNAAEMGNDTQVPGSCNGVISVAATGPDDAPASYSNFNPFVDIAAPGGGGSDNGDPAVDIATTSWWANGERTPEYIAVAGTSFAAPYVTGVIGLLRNVNPELTPDQIESILERSASDLGPQGRDDNTGWGLVQADAAVALAQSGEAVPAPEPDPAFPVGDPGEPPPGGGTRPGGDIDVFRVSAGVGTTEAITQAVAVSQSVFADAGAADDVRAAAAYGVLARADDYADALAGTSLILGEAPLLFTNQTGPLAAPTATELTRTLPDGATVYILGGEVALPATLEAELQALGFNPVRLAGGIREQTAVRIAAELDTLFGAPSEIAILANREDWPDAVGAGQLSSQFGIPVFLTPAEELDPSTQQALNELQPDLLYVVGGTVRVTEETMADAGRAAGLSQQEGSVVRLAGEERNGTITAVAAEVEAILAGTDVVRPQNALAVNVRRDDGFAHVLSAAMPVSVFTGVYVPVEGAGGTEFHPEATAYAQGLGVTGVVMGDVDLITEETLAAFESLLETPPA